MRVMDFTNQGPENCSTTGFVRFILPGWVPALVPGQGSSFAGPGEKPLLQPGDPDHLPLFFPHLLLLLLRLPLSGQRTDLSPLRWQPCSGAHQKICRLPAHTGKHTAFTHNLKTPMVVFVNWLPKWQPLICTRLTKMLKGWYYLIHGFTALHFHIMVYIKYLLRQ